MPKAVFLCGKNIRYVALWIIGVTFCCIAVWATFGGFAHADRRLSSGEQAALLRQVNPLVNAIHAYEKDHAAPPPTLEALVPRYLNPVPPPPVLCSGRNYLYTVEPKQWRIGIAVRGERDGVLTYSSTGDYPAGKPGVSVERIGGWAYYHGNPY